MKTKAIFISTMTAIMAFLYVSCSEDDDTSVDVDAENYNTEVYITDAPIDNAEVDAVFITVADVQIDGQSLSGFEKTTIELSALTDGETQLLGDLDLEAKEYDDIDLILATDSDVNGDSPANYVVVDGSTKVALEAPNATINIDSDVDVAAQDTNQIVLDVDLRKAIVADEANGGYNFSSESQLNSSVRVVNTISTGMISGTVTNETETQDGVMVAYVYELEDYTVAESEENTDGVRFANSVSSSVVAEGTQDFTLHFLEADTYEVHFASYTDSNNDGMLAFEGMVDTEVDGSIALDNIEVNAGAEVTLDIILQSILFL
ncbi:DUF4382 domain-containing protein [Marixanthomonas ophiurae]|nr:DUF4382 domain-containing protein [Marixanthomonas ophiurae]